MGNRMRMAGWWALGWMACAAAHAEPESVPLLAPLEPTHAVFGEAHATTAEREPSVLGSDLERPGLLARWRKQLNRYTPRMAADAASLSLGESLDTQVDGPLRFRMNGPTLATGKPDTWSLKSTSEYADLRQMLRSRTLQWQPVLVGNWRFGAAVGPVRALAGPGSADPAAFAVMPMASYQTHEMEWRLGMVPASSQTQATLLVRLKLKAF